MPLYFNTNPLGVHAFKADGSMVVFPPRVDKYIEEAEMSASINELITLNVLRYRGRKISASDIQTVKEIQPEPAVIEAKPALSTQEPQFNTKKRDILVSTQDMKAVTGVAGIVKLDKPKTDE